MPSAPEQFLLQASTELRVTRCNRVRLYLQGTRIGVPDKSY